MNGPLWIALTLVAVNATGCAPTHPTPLAVTRFDDTLVYYGLLSSDGLARLKANDNGTARTLLIRSGGGDVSAGMDFGDWVFARHLDVVVDEGCLSSCANYVFPAGKSKTFLPGSLVAWHGNNIQPEAETDIEAELPSKDWPAARKLLVTLRAREAAFYAKIGVNECLDRFGLDVLGRHGFFTMSAEDMARFGVKDVHGAPASKALVASRMRDEVAFDFITVPAGLDAAKACGARVQTATPSPPPTPPNAHRAEAEYVFSALAAGDAAAAERRFSARMRAELPPSVLEAEWRDLLAPSDSSARCR